MGATLETINTARQLAHALNTARNDRDMLATRINNPICGKPHQGFKAMHKLRPMLAIADANVVAIEHEVNTFLNPPKANNRRKWSRRVLWGEVNEEIGA